MFCTRYNEHEDAEYITGRDELVERDSILERKKRNLYLRQLGKNGRAYRPKWGAYNIWLYHI